MPQAPDESGSQSPLPTADGLPEGRPKAPPVPCAACGNGVDPIRAKAVLVFDDGYRFLCDAGCVENYRGGERFRMPRTPALGTPRAGAHPSRAPGAVGVHRGRGDWDSVGARAGRGTIPARSTPAVGIDSWSRALPAPGRGGLPALRDSLSAWLALALGLAGLLLTVFAHEEVFALASGACSVASSCFAAFFIWRARAGLGVLGTLLGPVATGAAAYAAVALVADGRGAGLLAGAAISALSVLVRALIDADGQRPVRDALASLTANLPARARVPVADAEDPFAMAVQQVDAQGVRTGEEVIAAKGDVLAVDGVVQAGVAAVRPHPGAETTVTRRVGDPVLAGAVVTDGALRLIATRVGDQRALVRIASFGGVGATDGSPATLQLSWLRRFGGGAAMLLSFGGFALLSDVHAEARWSAMAAILIATPLLGVARALRTPALAAGIHGAACGIIYGSAAALERCGKVTTVAMAPHGTLTEGKPEVVEMHCVGDGDRDVLLSLVAAAERAIETGPIPQAVVAYARACKVSAVEVRRVQHIRGQGVTAITSDNQELIVGSRRFLLESGISVAVADAEVARAEASARTSVFVALDGRVQAVITLQDSLRIGARAAVQRMFDGALEVVLLTGDQRGPIETLASRFDIAHVKAELLPEERASAVRGLREAGVQVAVVGYHGQDDSALASADVGIALGAAGGMGAATAVALVSTDLQDAAAALWIAQAARKQSLRALRVSVVGFGIVFVAASTGLLGPGLAALLATALEGFSLSAGARLLRRFALRLPAHS